MTLIGLIYADLISENQLHQLNQCPILFSIKKAQKVIILIIRLSD